MGWDSEHFKPKNRISRNERKADENVSQENKAVCCVECNDLITIVSVTLYEIEEKHYCSKCYSRKIINMAVERDHFDLKQGKGSHRNKTEKQTLKPHIP
jgi:hypothetical protein